MASETGGDSGEEIGALLLNKAKPLKDRFRALFTLRNLGGKNAVGFIAQGFDDPSALLKHELAYCLGQMRNVAAIPTLNKVLQDESQEAMVRHEAGEALGAIGSADSLEILGRFANDPVIEVAETCQLAIQRINWLLSSTNVEEEGNVGRALYLSVDPAPPAPETNTCEMRERLLDESLPLFQRYRAMFSLRNCGGQEAVLALAEGLKCSSALFRHEIAYVLGQMQHEACVHQLAETLRDTNENPMVRHECAEALGAIASYECSQILQRYLTDEERVVRESCVVALDISEYENSGSFQYADTLSKITQRTADVPTDHVGVNHL